MNRVNTSVVAALLAVMLAPAAWAEAPALPEVKAVTEHLDALYQAKSSHATMRMEITTKHFSRTLELESWSLGKDMMLAVIRKPARESGTATLKTADGLWNFAPRADRLMRVPPGLLSEGWMGSHFTNDDLVKANRYETEYDTTCAWVTEEGERMLRLTMIPKEHAAVVHTKVEFYVTAEGWIPRRSVYWDEAEIVRNDHFKDVKTFGGRQVPAVMEVVPMDKPGEKTRVTYTSLEFDAKVSTSLFTPRGLRKKAQQR
jgi:outer membrane lipoprotein-sorting protein